MTAGLIEQQGRAGRGEPGEPRGRTGASRFGLAALRDAGAVVLGAGRLFLRHWPVLFALVFAGMALRELAMEVAVRASAVHAVLGLFILVLAPIATLSALVLSLRVVRPSLPWLSRATEPGRTQLGVLDQLGSVLVPFLAVYASYGYLKDDLSTYSYRVLEDALFGEGGVFDGGHPDVLKRLPVSVPLMLAVVPVAFVLRWLLGRARRRDRTRWLGVLGAYVEAIWIVTFGGLVATYSGNLLDWARERRVVSWAQGTGTELLGALGPLTRTGERLVGWVGQLITSAEAVIVVPVAWLAVGAVVYGRRLAKDKAAQDRHEASPPAVGSEAAPAAAGPNDLTQEQQRVVDEPPPRPGPLRRTGRAVGGELRERFLPLIHGLRLLGRAGLRPMLLFCLVFLILQTATKWLWEVERFLIGPRDLGQVWMPVSRVLATVNDAIGHTLLACLLAAAVDRVLATQHEDASGSSVPASPPAPPPAGPANPAAPAAPGPAATPAGPGWNQPTVSLT
ncbi:hypothetical protein [Rhizomonospora bruguierae]|uniref:hypothetical protein n=1 Tax=Rhizomonospora bruguierae TaxID=1581705 RepID=UPI001BCF35DB|nr:hypothetical protein [Micromonospora sp. NBRC 107566]